MDARHSLEQTALFPFATADRTAREIEVLRHDAIRARDAAIAQGVRSFFRGLAGLLGSAVSTVASWPDRHQTYENLRALTDRELADIGLTRGEINRVFEPNFRMPAKPAANGNQLPAGKSVAA